MIQLRTLGRLELRDANGGALSTVTAQPKRVALLCYLAVAIPRGFHRRDTLLGIFWPEATQERARHALNQSLYVLRRSLGEGAIETQGEDAVALNVGQIWCDAAACHAAIDAGDRTGALDLYAGDLLPGFHLSDSTEFDRWLESERARLRARAIGVARELAEQEEASTNWSAACHWWRRALALDELEESLLRRLLTALASAGDHAGAVREYESFVGRLQRSLELSPSPETVALIEDIRRQRLTTAPITPSPAPAGAINARAAGPEFRTQAKTSWLSRRKSMVVALGGMTLAMVAAGAALLTPDSGETYRPKRVLITELENRTVDPRLALLGRIASDWIAQELARTSLVEVIPMSPMRTTPRGDGVDGRGASLQRQRELARQTGAGIVVTGAYHVSADSIVFQAHIVDGRDGRLLRSTDRISAPARAPMPAVDALRQRVTGMLATIVDRRLGTWANAASQPPSFEAYQLYAEALTMFLERRMYRAAAEQFRKAAAEDSTFTAPLIWAIQAYQSASDRLRADSLIRRLEGKRESLPPWDRAMLEYNTGVIRGDLNRAYRAMRAIVERSPRSEWTMELAAIATFVSRPREAVELLTALDPATGWVSDSRWRYWNILDRAYHHLDDYEAELVNVQRMRRDNPDAGLAHELRALAGLGRHDEVARKLVEFMGKHPPVWGNRGLAYGTTLELRVHGQPDISSALFDRVIAWYRTAPALEQGTAVYRYDYAAALFAAGRLHEAYAQISSMSRQYPRNFLYLGTLGVLAARLSDTLTAERALAVLEKRTWGYASGEPTVWAAAVAANLGDNSRALALYQRGLTEGFFETTDVHYRPELEPLHRYAPFLELRRPKG